MYIKIVPKARREIFRANKKGDIIKSTIPMSELKKYVNDFALGVDVDVYFRINKKGEMVIEDIFNRRLDIWGTPEFLDTAYMLLLEGKSNVKLANVFSGTKEQAVEVASKMEEHLVIICERKLSKKRKFWLA